MTQPRVIFVFGSNLLGQHLGGAARDAHKYWGAQMGVGVGMTGESYAIPTIGRDGQRMSLDDIGCYVGDFLDHADRHPEHTFYVTPIGCGIAGYRPQDIAPLFDDAPTNMQLPIGWRELAAEARKERA